MPRAGSFSKSEGLHSYESRLSQGQGTVFVHGTVLDLCFSVSGLGSRAKAGVGCGMPSGQDNVAAQSIRAMNRTLLNVFGRRNFQV